MVVDEERMRANLELTHGALYSQRALLALVEAGRSRDEAYRVVQEAAQRAYREGVHLRELLAETAPELDLDSVFDARRFRPKRAGDRRATRPSGRLTAGSPQGASTAEAEATLRLAAPRTAASAKRKRLKACKPRPGSRSRAVKQASARHGKPSGTRSRRSRRARDEAGAARPASPRPGSSRCRRRPQPPPPPAEFRLPTPIAAYSGAFGVRQAERLLWRAGFGPSPGHAEALAAMGLHRAVASLTRPAARPCSRAPRRGRRRQSARARRRVGARPPLVARPHGAHQPAARRAHDARLARLVRDLARRRRASSS